MIKNNSSKYCLALALGLALSGMAHANSVNEEIVKAQTNTQLFNAKIAEAEAKAKLDGLVGVTSVSSSDGSSFGKNLTTPKDMGQALDLQVPYLVAIYGRDKYLVATLRYASGLTVDVQRGDRIDGDYHVHKIKETGVVLTRDGKTYNINIFPGSTYLQEQEKKREAQAAAQAAAAAVQGGAANFGGQAFPR